MMAIYMKCKSGVALPSSSPPKPVVSLTCTKGLDLGFGRHVWDVPVSSVPIVSLTYPWTVFFIKLSILFLYRRLFHYTIERVFIWGGIVIVGSLYTTFVIMAAVNTA
ncbi:uncharacterized protein BDV17DRAFT_262489 [Aspergillus undulatus]|uniref:uncharacterized protein n=1 Tax=Aspergillus undulatus TaxID=1810928 RepID=UPI003CCE102D